MSDEKAIIIRPPAPLAQRLHSPRQLIPAAGAALALTWGIGRLAQRLWANRRATPVSPPELPPRAPDHPGQSRLLIYRASWSITIIGTRKTDSP